MGNLFAHAVSVAANRLFLSSVFYCSSIPFPFDSTRYPDVVNWVLYHETISFASEIPELKEYTINFIRSLWARTLAKLVYTARATLQCKEAAPRTHFSHHFDMICARWPEENQKKRLIRLMLSVYTAFKSMLLDILGFNALRAIA